MRVDPQIQHLGIATPSHHYRRGEIRLVGQPLDFSRTPARVVTMTPESGEHTSQVLRELGYKEDEIRQLREA